MNPVNLMCTTVLSQKMLNAPSYGYQLLWTKITSLVGFTLVRFTVLGHIWFIYTSRIRSDWCKCWENTSTTDKCMLLTTVTVFFSNYIHNSCLWTEIITAADLATWYLKLFGNIIRFCRLTGSKNTLDWAEFASVYSRNSRKTRNCL